MNQSAQIATIAVIGLLIAGCPGQDVYVSSLGTGGSGTGGAAGAADAGDGCPGECVPLAPLGWSEATLLWTGASPLSAPECPERAPVVGYEGQAGLDAPGVCGACSCEPPSGSCALPATLTAAAATCAGDGPGVPHTSFDPPAAWDGTCNASNPIPAGKLCNGVPCVQSLTIAPLGLTETGCMPVTDPVPASGPVKWQLYARACRGSQYFGLCPSQGDVCAPTSDPPPPGFSQCVFHEGDQTCPAPFSKKHVFYDGLTDDRSCAPCACGAPAGSVCSSQVSVYKDGACSALLASNPAGSTGPNCAGIVPAGPALGSKSATTPTYAPGACPPSGGEPMGSAEPEGPSTFCCLP